MDGYFVILGDAGNVILTLLQNFQDIKALDRCLRLVKGLTNKINTTYIAFVCLFVDLLGPRICLV